MQSHNRDIDEIKLPFEERPFEFGVWVYDHRAGLCATLGFYVVFVLLFMSIRIEFTSPHNTDALAIDLQPLAELERERDHLKDQVEKMQSEVAEAWESIQNSVSNEASNESSTSSSTTAELLDAAEAEQRRMESNRAAYEEGLAEAQAMIAEAENAKLAASLNPPSEEIVEDGKAQGNVTVSYIVINPIRYARKLVVPAYLCQGGDKVVVRVQINHAGEVIAARVTKGGDECMQEAALASALASRFDINKRSPEKQNGTITYIFVPQ